MHCVVTGGLGFIGSALVRRAVAGGATVTIVDNLLGGCGGRREHAPADTAGVDVVIGDARDRTVMGPAVEGADVVFSLAGKVSHIESMTDPLADLEHNVRAPLVTLEAVRSACPNATVVFASTRQVYGTPEFLPVTEAHPLRPVDVNGVHKVAAEHLHGVYAKAYGLRTVNVRLTNIYGPRQVIAHDRHGFIGWFVRLVLEDRPITVFGDGAQRRDFCFVNDAAEGLWRIGQAPFAAGEAYNLAGPAVASLAELAGRMCAVAGRGRVQMVPFPPDKQAIAVGDCVTAGDRLAALLGWRPTVGLDEGLAATLAYFQEHFHQYTTTGDDSPVR